jgi:molybdopterin-guanine dinucleotide biosynthesis protein A
MAEFENAAAFVLAGGASARMGRDKALLAIGGVPVILRTARLAEPLVSGVTIIGAPEKYAALGYRALSDLEAGQGPLGGIATALAATVCEWNLVLACDLPFLTAEWLRFLVRRALASRADAVIPVSGQGAQPLCAMYASRCGPAVRAALARGVRKVTDGLAGLDVDWLEEAAWKAFDSGGLLFKNMNSPEEYAEARARLEGKR